MKGTKVQRTSSQLVFVLIQETKQMHVRHPLDALLCPIWCMSQNLIDFMQNRRLVRPLLTKKCGLEMSWLQLPEYLSWFGLQITMCSL